MKYLYERLGKGIFAIITATIPLLEIRSAHCSQLQFSIPLSENDTQRMRKSLSAFATNTFPEVLT